MSYMEQTSSTTSEWRNLEGQVVDKTYFLTEFLGAGSYAGVFRADHVVRDQLIKTVAVKLIAERPSTPLHQQLSEATLWTNVAHPSIVNCSTVGCCRLLDIDYIYLITELASDSLDRQIARGPLPELDVLALTRDLLGALDHLHSRKPPVVHRDVKPANVLKITGHWKLSDFGTAKQMSPVRESGEATLGTPAYAPPESLEGIETTAWDMWSLGVVIYEAITGNLPFSGSTSCEIRESALNGEMALPKGILRPLATVARRCLRVDYSDRITAEQALKVLSDKAHRSKQIRVPGDYPTLQDAICNVGQGQEIIVDPGIWNEKLIVDLPLTLTGSSDGEPTVICSSTGDTITVKGEKVRIRNLTIQSSDGCAVVAERDADVELDGVQIADCRKHGLLACSQSKVSVASSQVRHCRQSGCRVELDATVSATDVIFERSHRGCGVIAQGAFQANRCSFFANANAGVWTEDKGNAKIDDSSFEDNSQRGIYAAKGAHVSVARSSFLRNGRLPIDKMDGANVVSRDNLLR